MADDLAAEQQVVCAATAEAGQAAALVAELDAARAALPAELTAARAELASAAAAAEALPSARAERERLRALLADARELDAVTGRLGQLREEHVLARETLVSLREKEGELREARLVSMLAELADRLEDGAPCEVCGATSHPDPYEGAGEGVTRDDEDRARLAAEQAAREVADVEARLAVEAAVADALRDRLGGADVATLQQQVAAAQDELASLSGRAAGRDAAEAAVAALVERAGAVDADRARAVERSAAAERRRTEAAARAAALSERLAGELDGAPDLAAALERAAAVVAAAERVVAAAEQAERAREEAVRATATAETASRAAAFASVAEAELARRSPAWRSSAEQRSRAEDDERAALEAVLADPALDGLPQEPADVASGEQELAAADRALNEARGVDTGAAAQVTALEQLVPTVVAAQEALEPLERTAALVRRTADLCAGGGSNALRMRLTSFVLAARLEEVAAAASSRLLRMTQGRYSLLHTDGAAKGGARSGLGLLARDSWTGQDRETSTLSGGETFLASLALALGLADVVQAEAGGTSIDALFVDEGFGTLDEDTLDEVMDVLDGLREGGRVVGLVSHVAELRARIPAQVRVVQEPHGQPARAAGGLKRPPSGQGARMTTPLRALALVCSLKPSPAPSSSDLMARQVLEHLAEHDVTGEVVRVVDHDVKPGVETDMGDGDAWPSIREKLLAADVLLMVVPTWVGQASSIAMRVLERLDAEISETDDSGQPTMFGKVAIVGSVGNEDGAHHVSSQLFQALNDIGFTVPAQGATYWNGEAMHGTDYNDLDETPEKTAGTNAMVARNAAHLARLLKDAPFPG